MQNLELHLLDPSDADKLLAFELSNRAYFERLINARSPDYYHIDSVRDSIHESLQLRARDLAYHYVAKVSGEIVARVNLTQVTRDYYNKAVLGYRVGESMTGKGVASKAIELVLTEAFDTLNLWRVEAVVREPNLASIRVLQKNHFVQCGRSQQAMSLHGVWCDLIHFECFSPKGAHLNAEPD